MSDADGDAASSEFRFDDGKANDAMRTIGEVAQALGIKQHVLRYWEQQFPMLRPLKRSGGRRYYRREDVALVERIDRLINREGYTLKGARQLIDKGPSEAAQPKLAVPERGESLDAGEIVTILKSIRSRLVKALEL